MHQRRVRALLDGVAAALLLATVALFACYPALGRYGPHATVVVSWFSCVVCLLMQVTKQLPANSWWPLVTASIGVGSFADTMLILIGRPGEYAYPPVLVGYLACYVLGVTALWHQLRTWTRGHYAAIALDGALLAIGVMTVLGSLAAAGVMNPAVPLSLKVAGIVFPVFDSLLIGALARAFVGDSGAGRSVQVAILAMIALIAYHAIVVARLDQTPPGDRWDELWVVCFVLLAVASTRQGAASAGANYDPEVPSASLSSAQSLLLAISLGAGPSVIVVFSALGRSVPWFPLGIGGLATASLATVRIRVLLREIEWRTERIAHLARVDPLTGVANRRTWDTELAAAVRAADDQPTTSLWVAILDLDRFKQFNDTHGHQAGDDLLAQAVTRWEEVMPSTSFLARYGGEEFTVLLYAQDSQTAVEQLEELRRVTPNSQTVSIGIARHRVGLAAEDLMREADLALYEAKANGRDQVVIARRDA